MNEEKRTYLVTTVSGTECLVLARDEDEALRAWSEDPDSEEVLTVRPASAGEICRISLETPEYDYR